MSHMIYLCDDCRRTFEEPDTETIDMESYNGVGSMFADHHYAEINVCPFCGSEELTRTYEEEIA